MISNSEQTYGWISIALHWISVLVVITLFSVGLWMTDLDYYSEWYRTAPHWHKSTGILFCGLVVFRLIWNLAQTRPQPHGTKFIKKAAKGAHALLYLLLIAIFITGYLISTADNRNIDVFNWFSIPGLGSLIENQEDIAGEIHEWLAFTLIGLAVLHGLAALKHHVIDKDNTLTRMLKPSKSRSSFNQ